MTKETKDSLLIILTAAEDSLQDAYENAQDDPNWARKIRLIRNEVRRLTEEIEEEKTIELDEDN